MPWIDHVRCTGCGVCIEECPVGAIVMDEINVEIKMSDCIRCGVCHDICPKEAVRHDSEKISDRVESNIELTMESMDACVKYLGNQEEKKKCLNRMIKHFRKEKIIAEKTLKKLRELEN